MTKMSSRTKVYKLEQLRSYLCCGVINGQLPNTKTLPGGRNSSREACADGEQDEISALPDPVARPIHQDRHDQKDKHPFRMSSQLIKQSARVSQSMKVTETGILDLPDEILLEIFSAIRFNESKDPVADLCASLKTCRRLYQCGMPLLYQDFVMDVNYRTATIPWPVYNTWETTPVFNDRYNFTPSARFYDAATKLWSQPWKNTGVGYWIHSLSIEIHFEESEGSTRQQSITDIIQELPNIKTFSVRGAPLHQGNYILKSRLTNLITNMPAKIINFELDLQSRDSTYEVSYRAESQLCKALGNILPQLHTLRLRLAVMCPEFLAGLFRPIHGSSRTCQNLRALSISLCTRSFIPMSKCCSFEEWIKPVPPAVEFIDALEARIQDKSTFPSLKACSLICLRNDMAAPNRPTRRIICKTFQPLTRTWRKRAYFPSREGFEPPTYVRTDADFDESEMVMLITQPSEFERVNGNHRHGKETDALLEGNAVWTEDAFGARYPPRI